MNLEHTGVELWSPANELPGYFISSHGRMFRIRCVSTFYHYKSVNRPHRFLKPCYASGYPAYNISISNKALCKKIHRLVAQAFIPNPDNNPCVNHIDGNKLNYAISNLEWTTVKGNVLHAHETGLITYKRKDQKVMDRISEVKEMHNNGMSRRQIQLHIGCSRSGIQRLFRHNILTA